ncbi:unnamed protein product [Polarella glacialis]|uniref:Uncharacterized protein n=1 Tax=Polarella glacialis TaxID=89957 RepID=A0A813FWY2_POLGL|nr:unnamed protein product [Polarella glacialis]
MSPRKPQQQQPHNNNNNNNNNKNNISHKKDKKYKMSQWPTKQLSTTRPCTNYHWNAPSIERKDYDAVSPTGTNDTTGSNDSDNKNNNNSRHQGWAQQLFKHVLNTLF